MAEGPWPWRKKETPGSTDPMYENFRFPFHAALARPWKEPGLLRVPSTSVDHRGRDRRGSLMKPLMPSSRNCMNASTSYLLRMTGLAIIPAKLEFFGAQMVPNSVPVESQIAGIVEEKLPAPFGDSIIVEASPGERMPVFWHRRRDPSHCDRSWERGSPFKTTWDYLKVVKVGQIICVNPS